MLSYRFMYTEEVSITANNVLYLMSAARKYILESLVETCSKFLETNISEENVCTIFNHSVLQSEERLVDVCVKFIQPRAGAIFQTESFLELNHLALTELLKSDTLEIDKEVDVFNACVRWVQRNCNTDNSEDKRKVLGGALFQVRYLSIDAADLTKVVGISDLLTDREFRVLRVCCSLKDETLGIFDEVKSMGFNLTERQIKPSIIKRFANSSGTWSVQGHFDAINLTLNQQVKLRGTPCYVANTNRIEKEHHLWDKSKIKWSANPQRMLWPRHSDT